MPKLEQGQQPARRITIRASELELRAIKMIAAHKGIDVADVVSEAIYNTYPVEMETNLLSLANRDRSGEQTSAEETETDAA
jgi:hypothetical protein